MGEADQGGRDQDERLGPPADCLRCRLTYWYAKLKALEASFDVNANAISLPETKIEIERIEDAVSHIRFPLTFTGLRALDLGVLSKSVGQHWAEAP
jgi:hypothetical protein